MGRWQDLSPCCHRNGLKKKKNNSAGGGENDVKVFVTQSCLTFCNPIDYSPTRLLRPWDSPGRNTGMGCHALLQGIFPTQGSNLGLVSPVLAGGFFTTSATREACPKISPHSLSIAVPSLREGQVNSCVELSTSAYTAGSATQERRKITFGL